MDVFKDQFAVLYCCNALLQVRLGLGAKASWLVFQVFAESLLVFGFFLPRSKNDQVQTVETGSKLEVASCLESTTPPPSALHSDKKTSLHTFF